MFQVQRLPQQIISFKPFNNITNIKFITNQLNSKQIIVFFF